MSSSKAVFDFIYSCDLQDCGGEHVIEVLDWSEDRPKSWHEPMEAGTVEYSIKPCSECKRIKIDDTISLEQDIWRKISDHLEALQEEYWERRAEEAYE